MFKRYKEFKNNKIKYKGFTLIELLAILLILFIIFSIVVVNFKDVFKTVEQTISVADKKIILRAANDYALEYRGSENWVEQTNKNGDISFCVSLESLINYGYFKNDGNNFEKYKKDYVVDFTITNGVYNYDFIRIDESENCKRFDFTSGIPGINDGEKKEIITQIKDNIGEFKYQIGKISEKKYSLSYDLNLNLIKIIKDIYVTLVLDKSSSMLNPISKYDSAINAAIQLSNSIIDNDEINSYISLITFDGWPEINRGFEHKALTVDDFPDTGGGTNLVSGLDLAISYMCHEGLYINSDSSKWCSNIANGNLKKDFKTYTIVLMDGDNGYVPRIEYKGEIYDGKRIANNELEKEIYYKEFLEYVQNNNLIIDDVNENDEEQDGAYADDFYNNYIVNSVKYLKDDVGSNLFFVGYEFWSRYGDKIKKLPSFGETLCSDGNENYCYYDSKEENLSIILETIRSNIINDSMISSIKFSFKPLKKDGKDLINILNSSDKVVENNILIKEYTGLSDYESDLKESLSGYRFLLNDVLYDYCSFNNDNTECSLNMKLFNIEMEVLYENGSTDVIEINAPEFNIILNKVKTLN